ncbi:anti-sigma-I factor RsgI family protein [Bacillus sp. V33-4]|uniref:anti-sigma-I factor RsgI family protein n=1 Tax=Bacillus sp. V33-4 TaxID=2054169 RepID=UPI000C77903E|nr:hypothetical protein [Bacillus sp. V33-4]PLR84347.1 hypothetical protein CVD23_11990 [Bacillus sp. V33-4]
MLNNTIYQGIVIEVNQEYVVIMCEGGIFKNIPWPEDGVPRIGQLYTYSEKSTSRFRPIKYLSLAAILVLSVIGYFLFNSQTQQDSYVVAIDINPSVEVHIDKQLNILKVIPVNDDGQEVIKSISTEDENLYTFIDEFIRHTVKKKYLKTDKKGLVAVTVVPLRGNLDELDDDIQSALTVSLNDNKVDAEVFIKKENKNTLDKAHKASLSINKYVSYKDLIDKGHNISKETIRSRSIAELKELGQQPRQSVQGNNHLEKIKPNDNKAKVEHDDLPKEESSPTGSRTPDVGSNNKSVPKAVKKEEINNSNNTSKVEIIDKDQENKQPAGNQNQDNEQQNGRKPVPDNSSIKEEDQNEIERDDQAPAENENFKPPANDDHQEQEQQETVDGMEEDDADQNDEEHVRESRYLNSENPEKDWTQ